MKPERGLTRLGEIAPAAMGFKDKTITCADCGKEFVWEAGEQRFYAAQGFTDPPRRCKPCRADRKQKREEMAARGAGERAAAPPRPPRPEGGGYPAVCVDCGAEFTLPFEPTPGKGYRCRSCFKRK
jgi:CxxC-x17-CxxC domain-containing protein